mgnify:CR=1 FL=1
MLRLYASPAVARPRAAFRQPVRRFCQSSLQHATVVAQKPVKSPDVSKLQSWLLFLQEAKKQFPNSINDTEREHLKEPAGNAQVTA